MRIFAVMLLFGFGIGPVHVSYAQGFVLKSGEGEPLLNGIVIKASPATGTEKSILVEQTFQNGGRTGLHLHEQGDELFYVVSGNGTATLNDDDVAIGPGDVIFVPRSAIHRISNSESDTPLVVVFFMDSDELAEQFRAVHERRTMYPDQPISPEERAEIQSKIGGSISIR